MTDATVEDQAPNDLSELPFACDLVMKGGITSGVVYPTAIVELAKDHRLHNIGGASAGAIAAVVAAAAEYGRQTGGGGFEALSTVPDELAEVDPSSGKTLLHRLFVPQPETREYFDMFFDQKAMKGATLFQRVRRLLPSVFGHSSTIPEQNLARALVFGLPVGAIVWLALDPSAATVVIAVLALAITAAVYLASRVVSGIRNMADDVQAQLVANMHGFVNGSSVGSQIGLTNWLHDRIEQVAGSVRPDGQQRPLTYGDLRSQKVGLVTLTTNLSQGSSENFPFADATWAFRREDMERLFPTDVVDHLVARGEEATTASSSEAELREQNLLALPAADDLPVLIGARISLSFPLVISAVPLWRITPVRTNGAWKMEYQRVWLSDGGICSNMPVHLFDSPLPSRPTYGISLGSGAAAGNPGPDAPDGGMSYAHRNVWRPVRTGAGAGAPIGDIATTGALLGEVLNTMQNWSDNSMTRALGVRDRICTVRLGDGEGGMHLDMAGDTILGLAPRGRAAGENLGWMVRGTVPEFAEPPSPGQRDEAESQWTRHRWTRLRSTILGLEHYRDALRRGWVETNAVPQRGPQANAMGYLELVKSARTTPYLPYRSTWTADAGTTLAQVVDDVTAVRFGDINTRSSPPFRELVLSARATPETEVDA